MGHGVSQLVSKWIIIGIYGVISPVTNHLANPMAHLSTVLSPFFLGGLLVAQPPFTLSSVKPRVPFRSPGQRASPDGPERPDAHLQRRRRPNGATAGRAGGADCGALAQQAEPNAGDLPSCWRMTYWGWEKSGKSRSLDEFKGAKQLSIKRNTHTHTAHLGFAWEVYPLVSSNMARNEKYPN